MMSTTNDNDDDERRRQLQAPVATDGTLTARIIPKSYLEYEHLKPIDQRLDKMDIWRDRVVWPDRITTHLQQRETHRPEKNLEIGEEIAMLDIQWSFLARDIDTGCWKMIRANLGMQRNAQETAYRTLRRLEISTHKKLECTKSEEKKVAHRKVSSGTSSIGDLKSSLHLMNSPNGSSDGGSSDEEDDLDGYRKFDIEDEMTSKEMWLSLMDNQKSRLWIDVQSENMSGISLDIDACPPTLLEVVNFEDFTADVHVGVPLVLEARVLHADFPLVVWFVGEEQVAFDETSYTPTERDLGKRIRVLISPYRHDRRHGCDEVYEFQSLVQPRPQLPALELRRSWIPRTFLQRASDVRVFSYNLMADVHLSTEMERRAKYADCCVSSLLRTRRIPMLLYEIIQHDADIICLQEVDATIFETLLRPALQAKGYAGFYSNKASCQLEGCAMFWSLEKFEQEAEIEDYPIRNLFRKDSFLDGDWDSVHAIRHLLEVMPQLQEVVEEKVGQILQVARLTSKDNSRQLVVGNTHLFYHPLADHVRLMQAFVVCKMLDSWCRRGDDEPIAKDQLIICGDLNSDPTSGAVQLLMNRQVHPDESDAWKNLDVYNWESSDGDYSTGDEQSNEVDSNPANEYHECDALQPLERFRNDHPVELPIIAFPSSFPKLISVYDPLPEFTNYVVGFTETLDYIFFSESSDGQGLTIRSSAPVPTVTEMENYPAIPNHDFPSDHVSVAGDFQWKVGK